MSAIIYDRRPLFSLKLAKNMSRLSDEARREAMEQYPAEVQRQVEKVVRLMNRRKSKDAGSSE